jgi:hypothetical protein
MQARTRDRLAELAKDPPAVAAEKLVQSAMPVYFVLELLGTEPHGPTGDLHDDSNRRNLSAEKGWQTDQALVADQMDSNGAPVMDSGQDGGYALQWKIQEINTLAGFAEDFSGSQMDELELG